MIESQRNSNDKINVSGDFSRISHQKSYNKRDGKTALHFQRVKELCIGDGNSPSQKMAWETFTEDKDWQESIVSR